MNLSIDIIRKLPKADLHCHLDGFCRPQTIIELAKEQNIELPTYDPIELKKYLTIDKNTTDGFKAIQDCLSIPVKVMQYSYAITRVFYESCEDAVNDGIVYIEIRFSPALHTQKGLSYSQIIEAAIDGVYMARLRLPITVGIICCGMRDVSPETNKNVAEIVWRLRHACVVGFDLAGPEYGFPPHQHIAAFRTMRERSVGLTIHAGESYGAKSVQLALACNANRIGHGTRAIEDDNLVQWIIDRRIPLEMCVTSNALCKVVDKLEDNPIKKLFDRGAVVVPCTDYPTILSTTLSEEYLILHQKFGFSVDQIVKLIDFSFRSAFVGEYCKKRMRIEAITKSLSILKENNIDVSCIVADSKYYSQINVSIPHPFKPIIKIPNVTLDIVRAFIKADCETRFIGSVPINLLYKFYCKTPEHSRKEDIRGFKDFQNFVKNLMVSSSLKKCKKFIAKLLQTEENIREGMKGILQVAFDDNVRYIEVCVSPLRHIKGGLTPEMLIDILDDEIRKFITQHKITIKIIISVNISVDSPIDVQKMAELTVASKNKNVAGFATVTQEITEKTMPYFQNTFDYLRNNFVSVAMYAGESDPRSIPISIVRGNARRLSGAFQITESSSLLSEISSHHINVLCPYFQKMTNSVDSCFSKMPLRSIYDFGVKVGTASINNTLNFNSRSQQIYQMALDNRFDIVDIFTIIHNSFGSMFQHYDVVKSHQTDFYYTTTQMLKDKGIDNIVIPKYHID